MAEPIDRLKPADALTIKLTEPRPLRIRVFQAEGNWSRMHA